MYLCMAFSAQGHQVPFGVIPPKTTKLDVVNLQIPHAAANLASPAVPLQHLPTQFAVALGIEPEARAFRTDRQARPLTSDRKISRCGGGRNW